MRNETEFRIWQFAGVHKYGRIAKGEKCQKSQEFDIPAIFFVVLKRDDVDYFLLGEMLMQLTVRSAALQISFLTLI